MVDRSSFAMPTCTALLIAALAAEARADFALGGTITEFLPGDFTDGVAPNVARVGAADGQFVFDKTVLPPGGSFVDFLATFTAGQRHLTVSVFTGAVTGAYLTAVDFINTANGTSASLIGLTPTEGALGPNRRNDFAFTFAPGALQLTPTGAFATYDQVALTFSFDNPGDRLALDAVSNPEPGTWALFGLGAVGLGVIVRRRRRRTAPTS